MMRKFAVLQCFLLAFVMLALPAKTHAQVAIGISVHIGPPPLRVYAQPICPGPDYMWTPGYWAYGDAGYYWVPGVWIIAPHPGLLWTPGYWGWGGGAYVWHVGYWGPHIGFYGGINYGFGYGGVGFGGGEWRGGHFFYNTAVAHVNVNIVHNTYINRTVIVNNNTHVAFNGGEGGVHAEPTAAEMQAAHEQHFEATSAQVNHEHTAMANRDNRDVRADNRAVRADNRAVRNDNRAVRNDNKQVKENKPAHNQKSNNHPQKEDHKPGGDR
jgi:hypothetical protein